VGSGFWTAEALAEVVSRTATRADVNSSRRRYCALLEFSLYEGVVLLSVFVALRLLP
jgi:hypothetical protein